MAERESIRLENFSHICIGVADMAKSMEFYTRVLGMDVVFDVELEGAGLEAVTGRVGDKGRMVGGLIAGTMVELLALGEIPGVPEGPHLGYTNMSLRVRDVDAAYQQLGNFGDVHRERPVDIGGLRMMFLFDPDGTPIELIELPGGAESTVQLWRPQDG